MPLTPLLIATGFIGLSALSCRAADPATRPASPLDPLRDRYRVLIVFAAAGNDANLNEQRRQVRRDIGGYAERDLTVFEVVGDNAVRDGQPLPPGTAESLRQAVHGRAFSVVLVGKDGTEKLRENKPVDNEQLFALIDSMPMRKNEARHQKY